jgi:uncharacterized membrane protein YoaK (UPF0700 family)
MNTTIEVTDEVVDALLIPLWMEIISSLLYLGAIVVVIVIAHVIVSKRGKAGYNLLVSIYAAILLTIAPAPLSFFFESDSAFIAVIVGVTYIGSHIFILMAAIHGLRYVLATTNSKES